MDAVTVLVTYAAALGIRAMDAPAAVSDYRLGFVFLLPLIVLVHLVANFIAGVYGHEWEHASFEEAMRLLFASAGAATTLVVGIVFLQRVTGSNLRLLPIGVVVLGSILALGGMGAARFRARMFSFRRVQGMVDSAPTVIVGSGRTAAGLARSGSRGHQPLRVIGFVATDPGYTRKRIADLPVLGSLDEIDQIVADHEIEQVLIAAQLDPSTLRDLVDLFVEVDVRLRIVPQLEDVLGTDGRLQDVRDLAVSDLLPRPAVDTDLTPISELLSGKRILITGAGGSIGAEITRQVLRFAPEMVVAVDNDETHLHDGQFTWNDYTADLRPILCDIRDTERLDRVFRDHKPQVVFHAAAHKHVPILETCPEEAVKTNIFGTDNLLQACREHEVEQFVLISTDKAVEPTSVMGASKRVAEMLTQSASQRWGDGCTHTAVRFGNVLGSRGSVVPTFMKQIQAGGPVTVTDPDMLRYFMTISEAVQLVLQVSALSKGGEVFVLDMGEPVRIGDLARRMIRLAGLVPGRDIEVRITGARPGEKKAEILSVNPLEPSEQKKIHVARPGHPGIVTLLDMVESLQGMVDSGTAAELREFLLSVSNRQWSEDETITFAPMTSETVTEAG
ncbi:MAG: nucleoside-diphosphate sugar epimerase/dehydratase [Acidimicrobiia bacterium]|nr:nucleoside-diphosphate sugar epimerase/dehydratase [Acidimicrobiia bacterium]